MTTPARPGLVHGTYNAYSNHGCRCARCREANRVHQAAARARRLATPGAADRAGHGKQSTYNNYGCRCVACRAAHTAHTAGVRAARRGRAS